LWRWYPVARTDDIANNRLEEQIVAYRALDAVRPEFRRKRRDCSYRATRNFCTTGPPVDDYALAAWIFRGW
jgi:hypothetical protein